MMRDDAAHTPGTHYRLTLDLVTLYTPSGWLVGWLEFNVPFQHKYGYIRDERSGVES